MANEKRLIYADSGQEAVEYLKRHLIVGDSEFLRWYLKGAEALADGLAKLTPVDAVEVVHGLWIERARVKGQVYCSECGTIEKATDSNYRSRLCPACGARMDGDADA